MDSSGFGSDRLRGLVQNRLNVPTLSVDELTALGNVPLAFRQVVADSLLQLAAHPKVVAVLNPTRVIGWLYEQAGRRTAAQDFLLYGVTVK